MGGVAPADRIEREPETGALTLLFNTMVTRFTAMPVLR
jgi:hypothetical protein